MLAVAPLVAFLSSVVAQQQVGFVFNSPVDGFDLVLPYTVAQCEPALFYYNITNPSLFAGFLGPLYSIMSPDGLLDMETFAAPNTGEGYIEWLCNLPAGKVFQIFNTNYNAWYTVQPGSDTSCIGHGGFEVEPFEMSSFLAASYSPKSISSFMNQEREQSLLL
jgi:hypothetical protein